MSKKETAVVEKVEAPLALVTEMDFAADAGQGMENAGSDSFAIPFLSILQKGSPQVDEASGVAIEGAKAGMIFENVTGNMFSGKDGVLIVPCAYKREFLRWGGRDAGGGFKGAYTPEQVADMRVKGEAVEMENRLYVPEKDGSVSAKRSDIIKDTREHYVLIINPETGVWTAAVMSLSSTQIKKSKMLMSALSAVKVKNAAGQMFTPPTFANLVRLTTIPESNDQGTWFGARFEMAGMVDRPEVYAAAKAFHANIIKGAVEVRYADAEETNSEAQAF